MKHPDDDFPDVTSDNEPDYQAWEEQQIERMAYEMDALRDSIQEHGQ